MPYNLRVYYFIKTFKYLFIKGFYRVNYDEENWRKLAAYLNSENYSNIHVLNRAQILFDAMEFSDELGLEILIDIVSYLHRETDCVAWTAGLRSIDMIFSKLNTTVRNPIIQVGTL